MIKFIDVIKEQDDSKGGGQKIETRQGMKIKRWEMKEKKQTSKHKS